jgi:hypothetical protein
MPNHACFKNTLNMFSSISISPMRISGLLFLLHFGGREFLKKVNAAIVASSQEEYDVDICGEINVGDQVELGVL